MTEADMVQVGEEFSMEMIQIRVEQRLVNPEDSNVEAEELEAINEVF